MKREKLSEIVRTFQIPDHFIKDYRKYILFRTLIFFTVAAAAVPVSMAAAGFSSRSPILTGIFCYLLILAIAAYNLKITGILFGKTWTGTISGIEYAPGARRTSILSDMYFTDMMVKLTVIPSKGRPDETFVMELGSYCKDATDSRQQRALGLNESHEGSFEKNPFYTKMPYETGDRLLFLRGLRYPLRMRPDDYTAQNVVCPFCGDVFIILTDLCPRCRRKLIYTEEVNMKNARIKACELLYRPADPRFDESIRHFQGCPTIAVTPKGRIYLGWYSGGTTEPHMENYNLVITSDDGGKTWSGPLLVIPSSKEMQVHALDIQLWCDPDGKLHVFWVQNNTEPAPEVIPKGKPGQPMVAVEGWLFSDFDHSMWETVSENPDDDDPTFSEPKCLDAGFLRCKPTVLDNGDRLYFNYDQTHDEYGYSISTDGGKSVVRHYGVKKLATYFDEGMAYQKLDGTVRMFARTGLGELAETVSHDNGRTWEEARLSGITAADTRFYVSRTPTGRILLVVNDDGKIRRNMTICLSEDDGVTWKYKKCIDTRNDISYPDCDFYDGKIYLTYDRERRGAKEILFACFTEEDVMNPDVKIDVKIVSKP